MWITTTKGYYSIVKYDGDTTHFIVRSRVKGDIEAMWPNAKVVAWPDRDYAFRARIPKWDVIEAMEEAIQAIDYPNFKCAVKDKRRLPYYGWVWSLMADMQDALEPSNRPYQKPIG
jgi:hypothetical protein